MDDKRIPDGPHMWDTNIVSQIIENKLNEWSKKNVDIGTIITFDKGGVSYHPNHISVYNGVMHLYNQSKYNFDLYTLETVNMFRKYIGFFDIFLLKTS